MHRRGLVVFVYVAGAVVFGMAASVPYGNTPGWIAVVIRVFGILLGAFCVIRAIRAIRGAKRFRRPGDDVL
jgi:hypothetical protein